MEVTRKVLWWNIIGMSTATEVKSLDEMSSCKSDEGCVRQETEIYGGSDSASSVMGDK